MAVKVIDKTTDASGIDDLIDYPEKGARDKSVLDMTCFSAINGAWGYNTGEDYTNTASTGDVYWLDLNNNIIVFGPDCTFSFLWSNTWNANAFSVLQPVSIFTGEKKEPQQLDLGTEELDIEIELGNVFKPKYSRMVTLEVESRKKAKINPLELGFYSDI